MTRANSRASSIGSSGGSRTPNSPSRPQLRRESAQDLGDDLYNDHSSQFKFCFSSTSCTHNAPPDLKIDLLSENSSSGKRASYTSLKSQGSSSVMLLGAPGGGHLRRHSNNLLVSPRNKSAPVTPLNRSTSNVNAASSNIPYNAVYVLGYSLKF